MASTAPGRRAGGPSAFYRAVALMVVVLMIAGLVAHQGMAAGTGKTIMLGESLSDAQRQELLTYFGAKSNDKIETVTVADTRKDMSGIVDASFDTAYSSTALTCRTLGDGLDVTTHNITLITPSMYAMALVTAGIGDATLVVASPNDAPSSGQAALSGVFKTWKKAPCDSGDTSDARQRLALEELALTADIGQSLSNITAAGAIVLNTEKTVVIKHLKKASDIENAVRDEEAAAGVTMPDDLRAKVVDLMVRLAKQKIDWSTFSAGWQITQPDPTKITMVGDGIAIRNAQMTATVRAANQMTATAKAAANMTKTARANQTATAKANQTATAKADAERSAAMTATAAAIPTKTPVPPTATATPPPSTVSGTITGSGGGSISIKPDGGGPAAAYQVNSSAAITRGGTGSTIDALKKGDAASLTVDFNNVVTQISAVPAAGGGMNPALALIAAVPILGAIAAWLLLKSRGLGEAFVIKRVSAA